MMKPYKRPKVKMADFICEGRNEKAMSKRAEELKIHISPEGKERIKIKMEDADILNMSVYLLKMAIDGHVIKLELPELREMISPAALQQ